MTGTEVLITMTTTAVYPNKTRQPELTRAVIKQLGGGDDALQNLEDVARHGANAGWSGFTYYSDTCAFFGRNKKYIIDRLKQDAEDMGEEVFTMVAGFGYLTGHKLSSMDIAESIFNNRGEHTETIRNALAWYALEEIAREMNPDL